MIRITNTTPEQVSAQSKACGNLEAEVKEAARNVVAADQAVDAADGMVERARDVAQTAQAAAKTAREDRKKANGNRIASLWRLSKLLDQWEKAFGPHKHRGLTFFKVAVIACGNDDIYYRAREIGGPYGYSSEQAARKAGESESQRTILANIARMKRAAEGGRTPGKSTAKAAARSKPHIAINGKPHPPVTPQAGINGKPYSPVTPSLPLGAGTWQEEHDEDQYEPLTTEELKVQTESWFSLFAPDPDSDEVEPQAIPAAILFAIENFFPGGLDRAIAWLKKVQRERTVVPEETLDVPESPKANPTPKPKKPKTTPTYIVDDSLGNILLEILTDAANDGRRKDASMDIGELITKLIPCGYKPDLNAKNLRVAVQACLGDLHEKGSIKRSEDRRYSVTPVPV